MKGRATNLHAIDPALYQFDKIVHVNINKGKNWSNRDQLMDREGIRRRTDDRNMHEGGMFEWLIWRDAWRALKEIIWDIGNGFHGI